MGKTKGHARTRAAGKSAAAMPAGQKRTWVGLPDPAPGAEEPIYMSFASPPDDEALAEAASYLASLEAQKQIARGGGPAPGATYQLEVDVKGRKRLVRKRFAAR